MKADLIVRGVSAGHSYAARLKVQFDRVHDARPAYR